MNENASPVTSYTVTASPGGATCTVNAPDLFCDIPVLPDQVYTFSVKATNAVGTSAASTSSLEIRATNGIAPTLITDPISAPTGDLVKNRPNVEGHQMLCNVISSLLCFNSSVRKFETYLI